MEHITDSALFDDIGNRIGVSINLIIIATIHPRGNITSVAHHGIYLKENATISTQPIIAHLHKVSIKLFSLADQ